ncbi:hypothetical protein [Ilumatobacter nonamiensis]|uniref:hypothetical protein n=1 Tax=Ilumatobacter nonamiensis TaxID=467093 RepID=UPI000347F5B6|nr:hypothetical protein [Ilumatobacter nonamiensis]
MGTDRNRRPRRRQRPSPTREQFLDFIAVVVAIVPVAIAAVRAAAGPWVPIGDDAYFTARSLDVGTADHPLLGAWSAGSLAVDTPVNNLGPMQLDLLAPFTRFTPMGGTAVGVACVHIAAIITIAWLVRRIAGRRYIVPAMAAVSVLAWSMGSEMLITPQQHQYLVLPYLCVMVAAWAVTCGDRWALVPAVVFGSLAAQTHLTYPVLLAALALPMIVGQVLSFRRDGFAAAETSLAPFVVSGVVAAVLWTQSAIDQFFVWGNFGDVLTADGDSPTSSLSTAVRIVADVVAAPTRFLRPGFGGFNPAESIGSNAEVAVLVVIFGIVLGGFVIALRRQHRVAAAGLAVATVTLPAAVLNASMLPVSANLGLLATNYRWLWAIVAYLLLGSFCLVMRIAPRLSAAHGAPVVTGGLAVLLVLTAVLNVPRSVQVFDPETYLSNQGATQAMLRQLESAPIDGPVIIDQDSMYLGHPYTYPILIMLTERGIDYRFEAPLQARRFGDARVADGSETQRLELVFGDTAEQRRFAPDTVAFVDGPPPAAVTLVDRSDPS